MAAAAPKNAAPFAQKLYALVDDPSTNSIVSWAADGKSFVVWNAQQLETEQLPRHFKHRNFSSFIRQLHNYGFRKTDTDLWAFANENFQRGQQHLLTEMHPRPPQTKKKEPAPSNSLTARGGAGSGTLELGGYGMGVELDQLKRDKNALIVEVVRLRQAHQAMADEMNSVQERLAATERTQQQTLAFMQRALQAPGLMELLQRAGAGTWDSAGAETLLGPARKRRVRQPLQLTAAAHNRESSPEGEEAAAVRQGAGLGLRVEGLEAEAEPVRAHVGSGAGAPLLFTSALPTAGGSAADPLPLPLDEEMFHLAGVSPAGYALPPAAGSLGFGSGAAGTLDGGLAWADMEGLLGRDGSAGAGHMHPVEGLEEPMLAGLPGGRAPEAAYGGGIDGAGFSDLFGATAATHAAGGSGQAPAPAPVPAGGAAGPSDAGGSSHPHAPLPSLAPLAPSLNSSLLEAQGAAAAATAAGGGAGGLGMIGAASPGGGLDRSYSWLDKVEMDLLLSEMEALHPVPPGGAGAAPAPAVPAPVA